MLIRSARGLSTALVLPRLQFLSILPQSVQEALPTAITFMKQPFSIVNVQSQTLRLITQSSQVRRNLPYTDIQAQLRRPLPRAETIPLYPLIPALTQIRIRLLPFLQPVLKQEIWRLSVMTAALLSRIRLLTQRDIAIPKARMLFRTIPSLTVISAQHRYVQPAASLIQLSNT